MFAHSSEPTNPQTDSPEQKTMNNKPTSKTFRHWLAAASLAVVTMAIPSAAFAGSTDPIAYWLGGGGANAQAAVAAGNVILKAKGSAPVVTGSGSFAANSTQIQQMILDATQKALFSTDANYVASGLPQKATASALAIAVMKRIPAYSTQLGQWATQAALTNAGTAAPLKYTDSASRTKDAQKVADQAMAIGLKSYPSGTQNSTFPGLVANKLDSGATAISSQVMQGAINATGPLGDAAGTINALSYSLVKAAAKSAKLNPLTVGSTVVGLTAQYAGTAQSLVNATIQGIVLGAAKAAKKNASDIAQGAGYALYAVYQETGGADSAQTYFDNNKLTIYNQIVLGGLKASLGFQSQVYNAFLTGIAAADAQLTTLGAKALSSGGFFAYNNGTGSPVTNVQDL
jgi:hypothetical protein